jgi:flagellar FliL protein
MAEKKEEKKEEKKPEANAQKVQSTEAKPAEGVVAEQPKKKNKKVLLIAGLAGILVLAGVAGFLLMGGTKQEGKEHEQDDSHAKKEKKDDHGKKEKKGKKDDHGKKDGESLDLPYGMDEIIYLDLKEFLVNLETGGNDVSFLKMSISLELPDESTKAVIENNLPRIRDVIQVYLRELKASELRGSAGLQRLREELIFRINSIIKPKTIRNVLFKEILVQ